MTPFDRWFMAFVVTLALEIPVVLFAASEARHGRWVAGTVLGNAVAHPVYCLLLLPWLWQHQLAAGGIVAGGVLAVLSKVLAWVVAGAGFSKAWRVGVVSSAYSAALGWWVNEVIVVENVRAAMAAAGGL